MSPRGRSRTVSPIALAQPTHDRHHLALMAKDNMHVHPIPTLAHRHKDIYTIQTQPVASSSRLDPCPPFSCSQSSTSSTSSDHTPAPVTPPALSVDLYPARYRSPSFDYYESPPSPPRTLQDQMHVAYAHDDMHLAKMLLLKLQGIELTDDQDPRIDQVKDEDFTSAFVPRGGLVMDAERERLCMESQRREEARRRRRAREERLKACEQIWETSARVLQTEKTKTARRKEAAACVRRRLDMEQRERTKREREEAPRPTRPVRCSTGIPRPVLSYDKLPALRTRVQHETSRSPPKSAYKGPLFDYPYLASSSPTRISPPANRSTKASAEGPYRELSTLTARGVPFRDVIASMHGPLFPLSDDDETPKKAKNIKQQELLKSLLQPATWDEETAQRSPSLKGKDRARVDDDVPTLSLIPPSISSSLTTLSSSTSIHRSTSWFSFGSRASVATAITTPSSSPLSCSKSLHPAKPAHDLHRAAARYTHTPRTLSTAVAPSSTPLGDALSPTLTTTTLASTPLRTLPPPPLSPTRPADSLLTRVTHSLSALLSTAAQFQRAYAKVADPELYFPPPASYQRARSRSRTVERRHRTHRPRPQGYRASSADVELFTATPGPPASTRPLIPLSSPLSSSPLSYSSTPGKGVKEAPRVFPAPPPIPRSPFRPPHAPATLTSRLRPVANPLLLRMRALQNAWAAELGVPDVREKVVGVAWEGIGRSGLGREVKA